MRLIPPFLAALVALGTLAACGTKTPLTLPPPAQPESAKPEPAAAADHSNKVGAEPRQ